MSLLYYIGKNKYAHEERLEKQRKMVTSIVLV